MHPASGLVIDRVSLSFGEVVALDDVSMTVEPGLILGLIGPNGSGKTTLINVMTGFLRPGGGRVCLAGRDISHDSPHSRVGSGLARTFQAVRLFPNLTVSENVEVGALGRGSSRRRAKERARGLLHQLGLGPVAETTARALPYGLERRVAIARAMATDPAFLLLDEPAAGLDEDETDDLAHAILRMRDATGCGMMVVEHDMGLITNVCDTVHVLAAGRTLAEGSPGEVISRPEVIEAYLGPSAVGDA